VRPELLGGSRNDIEVSIEDDPEMRSLRTAVKERARLPAGLEPLDREAWPDEIKHKVERPTQVIWPVGGRRHSEQFACRGQEKLSVHRTILPLATLRAGTGRLRLGDHSAS